MIFIPLNGHTGPVILKKGSASGLGVIKNERKCRDDLSVPDSTQRGEPDQAAQCGL